MAKKPAAAAETGSEDKRRQMTRIQASILRAALADVLDAVQARTTIPVLAHVQIEARDGVLTLSATDLDIWARRDTPTADRDGPASVDWISSIRPFICTCPGKALAAILAEMDGEAMVTLELREDQRIAVSAGRARFVLHSLPVADFPVPAPMAAHHSFEMPCSALADALARVDYAVSTEETRYYLNGVFMHAVQAEGEPQWLGFAATDGHRLALVRGPVPDGAASWPDLILPRGAAAMLGKLLARAVKAADKTADKAASAPMVQIAASDGGTSLCFELAAADGGEIMLQTKAIDGTFPDYLRVIPPAPEHHAVVDRAALASAIKRVTALATEKTRALRMEFTPDKIELTVISPDMGTASEELACSYSGPDAYIGFNGAFLRESLLACASDDVCLNFSDPGAPMLLLGGGQDVKTAGLVQVIMPMRV